MKRLYILAAIAILCQTAFSQKKYEMVVEKTDGTETIINVEDIVRTYFREKGNGDNPVDNTPSEVTAVDLGLSVKWANMNLGASFPEDYGLYYAWGETEGYNTDSHSFTWQTYKYYDRNSRSMTKYNDDDKKTVLDASDDAATMNWGSNWRTPSQEDFQELYEKCTVEWIQLNGVYGCKFTSSVNGNSIFLPAADFREGTEKHHNSTPCGYYWTSALAGVSVHAYNLSVAEYYLNSAEFRDNERFVGFSIRPIYK